MARLIRSASLRSASEDIERHTTWLEIFFDLIFAVILVNISDRLLENLSGMGILQCAALLLPVMWTWASYTVFAARFDNNDVIHWFMTFVIMFAGIIMAIKIPVALEKGATGFSIGFLIGQITLLLLYARTINDKKTPTKLTVFYLMGFGLGGIVWTTSLFFDSPIKLVLWAVGMCIYYIVPWTGRKTILSKAPLHSIYIPERFGAFTIIILGQIIASVVFGLEYASWNFASVFTSVMAFILAILIWAQYYRFTQVADYKCTLGSGQPYIYTHIPLIISMVIIGDCAEKYIMKPNLLTWEIHAIFCFALVLYLTSFYLLQYIAIRRFKLRGLAYLCGVAAMLALFFAHQFQPFIIMGGVVLIFMSLLGVQYKIGEKRRQSLSEH